METVYEQVSQHALGEFVGEFIDYLDFVSDKLENGMGLTRAQERERTLRKFSEPTAEDPIE